MTIPMWFLLLNRLAAKDQSEICRGQNYAQHRKSADQHPANYFLLEIFGGLKKTFIEVGMRNVE